MTENEVRRGLFGWVRESKGRLALFAVVVAAVALASAGVTALLVNIFERKSEAKDAYVKLVQVTEDTTDPEPWGMNWPRQYDGYKRTADSTRTQFGGSEALPAQKAAKDPWLTRMFAGYAFSIDYRDRRGHAYMLYDQEQTERVTKRKQPGSCIHCHASVMPLYRYVGRGDIMRGFEAVCAMPYQQAHDTTNEKRERIVKHPVSCVDCHDPKTMELRVTRPGFLNGIRVLKASQGVADYDPNRDATRQEMRSYVCGQCHVEYYFKGEGKLLTYPWHNGLKVEQIEAYYDGAGYKDWEHAETGAPVLKAQHPEFEMWNQGVHARSGVACADCHMPYVRQGALKISDHWIRSPLVDDQSIARSCQTCHRFPETEIRTRVQLIQERNHALMQRAAQALMAQLDAVKLAKEAGATAGQLEPVLDLQRKAQWRLDFVAAENSMGFHAPQEAARILGEAIDYARQGQAQALVLAATK
jgi:nitrite reductase (cytochrome c-552)